MSRPPPCATASDGSEASWPARRRRSPRPWRLRHGGGEGAVRPAVSNRWPIGAGRPLGDPPGVHGSSPCRTECHHRSGRRRRPGNGVRAVGGPRGRRRCSWREEGRSPVARGPIGGSPIGRWGTRVPRGGRRSRGVITQCYDCLVGDHATTAVAVCASWRAPAWPSTNQCHPDEPKSVTLLREASDFHQVPVWRSVDDRYPCDRALREGPWGSAVK